MKEKTLPSIGEIQEQVCPILERYGVRRAGVFGSVARGKPHNHSDIDLLVDIAESIGLLEFVGLKQELEAKLGRKVDLVEYQTIKPRIKERILAEEVRIL